MKTDKEDIAKAAFGNLAHARGDSAEVQPLIQVNGRAGKRNWNRQTVQPVWQGMHHPQPV